MVRLNLSQSPTHSALLVVSTQLAHSDVHFYSFPANHLNCDGITGIFAYCSNPSFSYLEEKAVKDIQSIRTMLLSEEIVVLRATCNSIRIGATYDYNVTGVNT